jgi:DNA polymerase III subunit delta'
MSRRPRAAETEAEEAPPEADRLEGFAHPRQAGELFGQAAAERELANALASGRVHHAWLLTGREGIGKATLAYRFARTALASPAERNEIPPGTLALPQDTITAKQVNALSHPGLVLIRRPWNRETKRLSQVIPVDEVRRLKGFLQHSAGEGAYRIAIIDRAEEMNASAANALLKSLEEPPVRTVFLLVSSEPGRLLPTVHSRCRRLELKPLGAADLAAAIAQAGRSPPDKEQAALIATLADGSVRRALELMGGGGLELHGKIVGLLGQLPRLDYEAVHKLAETVGGHSADQEFQSFFALLSDLIARLLRARATGAPLEPSEAGLASRLFPEGAPAGRLATWAELWETMAREKAAGQALNLDRKAFILDTFARFEAAARTGD